MLNRQLVALLLVPFLASPLVCFPPPSRGSQNQSGADVLAPQAATLIINEYLADPPSGAAGDANGDGVRDATQDEFIELVNNGTGPLSIGGFTISDATQIRFTFPLGKVIHAGECAVVFGGGTPTGAFGNAAANGLVFAVGTSEGLSLTNGGDSIIIKDNFGATVTSLTYASTEGNAGQSVTRSPDVTGSFVKHSSAAGSNGALFSPGTRVGGAPFITSAPVITSISPDGVIAGGSFVTMMVNGMNFLGGAKLRVDGFPVFTALFSSELIEGQIPESVTGTPGTHSITVQNPGGAVSNPVPFTVLGQIGINEYLADPPAGLAGDANGDGVRDSSQDEFVEIVNRTTDPIDVGGYTISDADAQRFRFPNGTTIPGGEAAVIFGGGTPQGPFGNARANGLVFTALLSLNNTGDTIALKNAAGVVIESITYGAAEGSAGQSINRNPDLTGFTLVPHSSIGSGRLFSPGSRVDGSPFTIALRLTSIVPNSAMQGDPEFDMTVNGSGFDGGSAALINGQPMLTAFVSAGQLIAHVPDNILAVSGAYPVQVRSSGGNRSNVLMFTVIAPPPTLVSLTPRTVLTGSSAFTLFLSGSNFTAGAVAVVDGTQVNTTFTNARELRANIPASLIATVGTRRVVVRASDGRESNALTFEVIQPTTILNSITPAQTTAGEADFDLALKGVNFKNNAVAVFDQTELATKLVSPSQLIARMPASLVAERGLHVVFVRVPDELPSNQLLFQVLPVSPIIGSLDPPVVNEGSPDVAVTINGIKFKQGAIVHVIDGGRPGLVLDSTFISSEQILAKVPAGLLQIAGAVVLGVENPDSGFSNGMPLKIAIRFPLVINEYLADPPLGPAGDANGDGIRSASQDEFVELLNRTAERINISGYRISDADEVRHVFPPGTIIPPFEAAVVFGGGKPIGSFGNAADNHLVFTASTGGLSLNNGGDTITLQDAQGNVIQQIKFGAAEGGARQSMNRDPDGDGATFSLHSEVAGDRNRLFSPGTKAAGPAFTTRPTVHSITPGSVRVGSLAFELTVSGANFLQGAVVLLSGVELQTTYRSDLRLEAQVSADLVADGGSDEVNVRNPKGELSGSVTLLVFDDPPRALRITPQTTGTGAENLEVSVSGERFQRGARVMVQGAAVETNFGSSTTLVAILPNSFFARAAELSLLVLNADGNQSNALTLTVENGPLITRLSHAKVKVGIGAFELTLGGVAFKQDVVLFVNDIPVSTTYVSDSSLSARIPAEMTNRPGELTLQARLSDGGRSNRVKLKVIE